MSFVDFVNTSKGNSAVQSGVETLFNAGTGYVSEKTGININTIGEQAKQTLGVDTKINREGPSQVSDASILQQGGGNSSVKLDASTLFTQKNILIALGVGLTLLLVLKFKG